MYHGTPAERAELRRTVMLRPGSKPKPPKANSKTAKSTKASTNSPQKPKNRRKQGRPPKPTAKATKTIDDAPLRRSGRRKSTFVIESDDDDMKDDELYQPEDDDELDVIEVDSFASADEDDENSSSFPIVLTTYEMIIKDRVHLAKYNWGYIVVDEGHRLKNLDCKLMKEIKQYKSAGRMILTGTPLHVYLFYFLPIFKYWHPTISRITSRNCGRFSTSFCLTFSTTSTLSKNGESLHFHLRNFEFDVNLSRFNLPALQSSLPTSQSSQIISSLHAILKPFLLRRMKVDVEVSLPPKKEYVLYAPLSVRQREAYDRVLDGGLRKWLIHGGTGGVDVVGEDEATKDDDETEEVEAEIEEDEEQEDSARKRVSKRFIKGGKKSYAVDGEDEEYFEMLERGDFNDRGLKVIKTKEEEEAEEARIGREFRARAKGQSFLLALFSR